MKMTAAEVTAHQRHHGFLKDPPKQESLLMVTSPDRIDFFVEIEPPTVTAQQKGERVVVPKVGKPFVHHFVKEEVEVAAKLLRNSFAPFAPAKPFNGPIRLVAEWTWSWRATETKGARVAGWKWKDTKPDAGNATKLMEDIMQELGFFVNDSQIADTRTTKMWGDRPGIRITIQQLENP